LDDDTDGVAQLRASDADRERTVAALRHHASVGRLTVDELADRSEQAYAAATVSELAGLQADLPSLATRPIRRAHGLGPAGAASRRAGTRRSAPS
jgi:DUF1707 SHOCT-like domain